MTVRKLPAGAASYRPGRGPHRRPHSGRGSAAAVTLVAAVLTAVGSPAAAGDLTLIGGLKLIDNSNADSWLEIDRTANTNHGSGTSGSDHDGSAVDLMDTLINPDRTDDDSEDGG
ncbi:hypothetical protein [Streptomyces sp. NPDC008125]|uniref:hypothetical protein n=1 Tax=Streptomyces sp. NPDC008125 TaxID=3364811 RepID=UPI0036E7166C